MKDPLQAQADIYEMTERVYLKVQAEGFGVGDWSDRESWFNDLGTAAGDQAKAMILDDHYQPKPAYYGLLNTLKQHVGLA